MSTTDPTQRPPRIAPRIARLSAPTCLLLSSFGLMTVLLTSMMGAPAPSEARAGTSTLMVLRMYSCMPVLMMLFTNQYSVRPLGTLRENQPAHDTHTRVR